MNHCVPDWKMEDDSRQFHDLPSASNQKKMIGQDSDLIELVWKNGHVVLHSQTNCRAPAPTESKQAQKPETMLKCGVSLGNSSNLIQEEETPSWLQNPLDDPLDQEFLEFFCDILNADPDANDKANKGEKCVKCSSIKDSDAFPKQSSLHPQHSMKLPSKPHVFVSAKQSPSSERAEMGPAIGNFDVASGNETMVRIGEPASKRTTESSICGSNQVQNHIEASHTSSNERGVQEDSLLGSAQNCRQTTTFDPMVASSSGGSGCSFGRIGQESTSHGQKRKGRQAEESECHIEDAEQDSIEENKHAQRSAPSRRSRAAEVHNLSERRRRDRINEKMRALQELIPHCNKSDKASMLDEAIEYLKSLQLQVQIMWMGSGMAPMLFPSVQQYMSHIGIGTGHPSLPSIPNPVQLRRSMLINQSIPSVSAPNHPLACPSPGIVPLNFPNQFPDICLTEPFSHYLGFPHMQMPTQVMNMYTYGAQVMQQNQTAAAIDKNYMPSVGASSENIHSGQTG